jgi:hypothetical protein
MKLNFLYPFFVGLYILLLNGQPLTEENVKLPGYIRTEIDTQYYVGCEFFKWIFCYLKV